MRKLLAPAAVIVIAVSASAIAADASSQNDPGNAPGGPDRAIALRAKQRRASIRKERRRAKKRREQARATAQGGSTQGGSTASPELRAIAACESGGNPHAVGGGGTFRGKYQFTYATWASVGGSGDPAAAPEPEQDRRAAVLLARSGRSQWPVCGR